MWDFDLSFGGVNGNKTRPRSNLYSAAIDKAIARITSMDITLEDGTTAQGLIANGVRNTNTRVLIHLRNTQNLVSRGGNARVVREQVNFMVLNHRTLISSLDRMKKNRNNLY